MLHGVLDIVFVVGHSSRSGSPVVAVNKTKLQNVVEEIKADRSLELVELNCFILISSSTSSEINKTRFKTAGESSTEIYMNERNLANFRGRYSALPSIFIKEE